MSLIYFDIGSQRPMRMPSSDTLITSPFAAMPGMPSVTRKEAFSMSSLRRKGCSPKLGRQRADQIWPGGVVRTLYDTTALPETERVKLIVDLRLTHVSAFNEHGSPLPGMGSIRDEAIEPLQSRS